MIKFRFEMENEKLKYEKFNFKNIDI